MSFTLEAFSLYLPFEVIKLSGLSINLFLTFYLTLVEFHLIFFSRVIQVNKITWNASEDTLPVGDKEYNVTVYT